MNRIIYPILQPSGLLSHTTWICELTLRTDFPLALVDFTHHSNEPIEGLVEEIRETLRKSKHQIDELEVITESELSDKINQDQDIMVVTDDIKDLDKIKATSNLLPLIILPDDHQFEKWHRIIGKNREKSNHFFHIFQQAEKHRIPYEVFQLLGKDRHLFNQFLDVFRKG
jgi:hypothetical protein